MKDRRVTKLSTTKIGPNLWRLDKSLVFVIDGMIYKVPKGFITDGASTPRLLWGICPPMGGMTAEAAVLHDWLYSLSSSCDVNPTRAEADAIFLRAMEINGVPSIRRKAVYVGVRSGGWTSFNKCYDDDKVTDDNTY